MHELESTGSQGANAKLHPIAFQSGTFKGSQLNWTTLTKEAFAIYMAFHKFSYYLDEAKIIGLLVCMVIEGSVMLLMAGS